jgi:hypothetical protein
MKSQRVKESEGVMHCHGSACAFCHICEHISYELLNVGRDKSSRTVDHDRHVVLLIDTVAEPQRFDVQCNH